MGMNALNENAQSIDEKLRKLLGAQAVERSDAIASQRIRRGNNVPLLATNRPAAHGIALIMREDGLTARSAARKAFDLGYLPHPIKSDLVRSAIRSGLIPGVTEDSILSKDGGALAHRPDDAQVYARLLTENDYSPTRAAAIAKKRKLVKRPVSETTLRRAMAAGILPKGEEKGAVAPEEVFFPGRHFGKWTVLSCGGKSMSSRDRLTVRCRCACGHVKDVDPYNLLSGKSCSCGRCGTRGAELGSESGLYSLYRRIIAECTVPGSSGWRTYGARSIGVCDEWRASYVSFESWAIANGWQESADLTITRLDPSGPFCPENCVIVGRKQLRKASRRANRKLAYRGFTMSIREWAVVRGIPYWEILARLDEGMTPEQALDMPWDPAPRVASRRLPAVP
jgi:hypothetical protein